MSDSERTPASLALDKLIAEAKEHLDVRPENVPTREETNEGAAAADKNASRGGSTTSNKADLLVEMDWSRLESRIMAAVEKEKPALARELESATPSRQSRDGAFRAGALVLAAAAAALLLVRKDRDVAPVEVRSSSNDAVSASSLRATEGGGEVRVGGVVATPGYVLHAGDSIDVNGARAVFERPRKVTWLLEQDSTKDLLVERVKSDELGSAAQARVKSAGEPLVLGLEHGVIEAQVVPVPAGEAFAVDVATDRGVVRVAVHGTHLRVARAGNRVVVDLTEGVVSIGVPPRTGVTYGTLVTAPAHVELDATDLKTLRVDHNPASVRTAIPLGTYETASAGTPRQGAPSGPTLPVAAAASATAVVKGTAARPTDNVTTPAAKAEPPKVALPPREAIAAAVRDCAAARARPSDVRVTVTSNLRIVVSQEGVVESAQFAPPLLPEIQSCAAQVIYKTKLEEVGLVTIPIEYSY